MDIKSFIINKVFRTESEIINLLEDCYISQKGCLITYFNQNSFNIFYRDKKYAKVLSNFNVYQEGIGMYIAFKLWGIKKYERIDASEMSKKFIQFLISKKETAAFIGGKFDENELKNRCNQKKLIIEFYSYGYFDDQKYDLICENLKELKTRFVLIGMGTPQQEFLAHKLSLTFPNKIFICIGNYMNYFLGFQKRAPVLIRRLQIEWLFRLLQEPKRLFKRYILGGPLFLLRVMFLFKKL